MRMQSRQNRKKAAESIPNRVKENKWGEGGGGVNQSVSGAGISQICCWSASTQKAEAEVVTG